MVDRTLNVSSKDYKSWAESASDYIFGASKKQTKFEQEVEKLTNRAPYKKGRLGEGYTQLLENEATLMWVGEMLMGSGFTPMNVVYDTGSDWLVVQGSDCTNCEGAMFDGSEGTQVNADETERHYGSASLYGYEYRDQVCLNPRACVDDFEYFLITQQVGLSPPIEGILGMSLNRQFMLSDVEYPVGPLFIDHLKQNDKISKNEFHFYM